MKNNHNIIKKQEKAPLKSKTHANKKALECAAGCKNI